MTDKVFVDTNILLYAHDQETGQKGEQANGILRTLWKSKRGRLSTQVLQEFYVNVTKKIRPSLGRSQAREIIRSYAVWIEAATTVDTILRASEISEIWQISFWDSLILASAEEVGASELFSEDLNSGQIIAGVKVVNPFDQS
ncbi:MAG: PIN domain-containing protein [Gloeobacterales cyanobacterium]